MPLHKRELILMAWSRSPGLHFRRDARLDDMMMQVELGAFQKLGECRKTFKMHDASKKPLWMCFWLGNSFYAPLASISGR